MSALWRWITLRHLFQEGGRTLLTLLGVALGVAVFVSIRLANHSAMAAFSQTVDAVAGKANLQVMADGEGFDEKLFPRIREVEGVQAAAPVVQAYARAATTADAKGGVYIKGEHGRFDETLLVLGIDLFSEEPFGRYDAPKTVDRLGAIAFMVDRKAAAITRALAVRRHLKLNDPLVVISGGQPVTLRVRQILDSPELQQAMGGSVVMTDIATAQEVFHRYGKLDRVDLMVDPARRGTVQAAIQRILPSHVMVRLPQGRTQQVENMVAAFGMNLTALSFIAMFVSMFLIFNAVSMSVLRRRKEIGILRSLGVTRREMVLLFLTEALALGVVGSAAGLALGTLMAQAALGAVARTITTLYLLVQARNLHLDPWIFVTGFALGVGMSVFSALAPAIEASRTQPSVTTRQGMLIEAQPLPIGTWTAVGLVTLLLAALVALWTVTARAPQGGFVSAFLLLIGFSLVSPGFTLFCEKLVSPFMRRLTGIEGVLGTRYLKEAVARTSVVVAALMVSVGMMIGLSIMVGSFRKTVNIWVNQTLRGDLYVEPVGRDVTGSATVLPPEVLRVARSLPEVVGVDTLRALQITYQNRLASVAAIDFAVQEQFGRLQFVNGNGREILRRARTQEQVVVSESFAFHFRVKPGDTLTLETPTGPARLPVAGVYYDYSTDAGQVFIDYHLFQKLWKDMRTESLALYLKPGTDPAAARSHFIRSLRSHVILYVTPNQALRSRVMKIFDQTFSITYALESIAIIVAVLGVISTLTALILQRGREIGILRAVGALRGQIRKMVLVESALLGLIGSLLGCACGIALAVLLTYVINKQFFGWSIRLTVDPWLFVQAVVLMIITAILSGLGPARLAATRVAAEAMRSE